VLENISLHRLTDSTLNHKKITGISIRDETGRYE
jgi:hypothetical protein